MFSECGSSIDRSLSAEGECVEWWGFPSTKNLIFFCCWGGLPFLSLELGGIEFPIEEPPLNPKLRVLGLD